MIPKKRNILITGAAGYLGAVTLRRLHARRELFGSMVALDVRAVDVANRLDGVVYLQTDVRSPDIAVHMRTHDIHSVIHLAAIISPTAHMTRAFLYDVEVNGTCNLLSAAVDAGVRQFVYASSGAVYGYHPQNPALLKETDALRGHPAFAYSAHKRDAENVLADFRARHPALRQLVLRPGTILGTGVNNLITDLFRKPVVLGLRGTDTPFVFIWDQDVADIIIQGVLQDKEGIYNLAGDGAVTLKEIAGLLNKSFLALPTGLISGTLHILKKLRLSQYGPEQIDFLRYRPVLCNLALKTDFGFLHLKSSREVFQLYVNSLR